MDNIQAEVQVLKNQKNERGYREMNNLMKKLKKKAKNNKGFSLVELLIALLIMAVIAAAAITLFGGVLQTSKGGADKETAESIKKAILTYMNAANDTKLTALGVSSGVSTSQSLIEKLACTEDITLSGSSSKTAYTLSGTPADNFTEPVDTTFTTDGNIQAGTYGPFFDTTKSLKPQQNGYTGWVITINSVAQTIKVQSTTTSSSAIVTIS